MFYINQRGEKEFKGGRNDWEGAKRIAEKCKAFQLDDDDELVTDDLKSCYNCCFRRWTVSSFTCRNFKTNDVK